MIFDPQVRCGNLQVAELRDSASVPKPHFSGGLGSLRLLFRGIAVRRIEPGGLGSPEFTSTARTIHACTPVELENAIYWLGTGTAATQPGRRLEERASAVAMHTTAHSAYQGPKLTPNPDSESP